MSEVKIEDVTEEEEKFEETNEEKKEEEDYAFQDDPEIIKLKEYAIKIDEAIKNNPKLINRVENKHDFASEVVNTNSNQKIANLDKEQIFDLIEKRGFMNFLTSYGWKELANLVSIKINDIENYSLSKKGFLIERAMVDNVRQAQTIVNADSKDKSLKGGQNV
jgi:hypothetical protein